jgi:aminoglycoside phosphotransferase (APT) family kinase protein
MEVIARRFNITGLMAMMHRDETELATRLVDWVHATWPDRPRAAVSDVRRPAAGWSNETLLLELSWEPDDGPPRAERLVLRLPTLVPSFPHYDLGAQARVLDALQRAGIPTARVVALELDDQWLGAPFLVMSFVDGRPGPELPGLDPWLTDAPLPVQRAVHERFLTALASVHRVDWSGLGLGEHLRGGTLPDEVDWWATYVEWATDGAPPRVLADAMQWCAACAPANDVPAALCWGDARLGNVMFDDNRGVTAVLDWELASIGPPEMDLAWYLALDALTAKFTGAVPGFLDRAEAIACYESHLGRAVADLEWHEIFALVRSTAINDRQARIAAATGASYPGVAGDENPVLRYIARRIERYGHAQ